ncbi:MAG: MBL fold metallo-hydrolase [Lachnospiraceae bacterium]|nr:MBL fold metallo-hydrolase [Lachnospiraceae bacterium]
MKNNNARSLKTAALIFIFVLAFSASAAGAPGDEVGPSMFISAEAPSEVTARFGPSVFNTAEKLTGTSTEELSGGMIMFLKNKSTLQQQLCGFVRSSDGKNVVIDGGVEQDAEHLYNVIKENGGYVDAWIITHPQTDHVGGLYAILRDHKNDIDVRNIYYRFFEYEWYEKVDPAEIGMLYHLMQVFAEVSPERLHSDIKRNDVINLSDRLSIRVMNDPKKSEGSFAVNGSGIMYDITVDGKHLVILGDMSEAVGNEHYSEGVLENLTCDYLQMSHHGQNGVGETFYKVCNPVNCIWNTTELIYNAKRGNYMGYLTYLTKEWISKLGVRNNYTTVKDDVVIR